ncbi:MAG: hypothetical protein GY749_00540 [Desulfobacteraceae bacterium]|nr:hypothetical protein [Desulfobacteraceae bacterium]
MKKLFIISALILLSASFAYAGCVDTFGIGSKATALGGAYAAYADDPYAAYYNPAGLTQLESIIFSAGAHTENVTIDVKNFRVSNTDDPEIRGPKDFSTDADVLVAPHLGFAMPIGDKVAIGIAAYAPWGLDMKWGDDPTTNPGAYNYYHSYYMREVINPTVAYKVSDKFSFGVGVSLGISKGGEERKLYVSPDVGRDPVLGPMLVNQATTVASDAIAGVEAANQAAGGVAPTVTTASAAYNFLTTYAPDMAAEAAVFKGYADQGLETPEQIGVAQAAQYNGVAAIDHGAHIEGVLEDKGNFSFNIGMMYKPKETLTLGLTFRSRTVTDFEGDVEKNGVKVADATLEYDHPEQVQFGIRYVPESNKNISVEADLVWTKWSINDTQSTKILSPGLEINVIPGVSSVLTESTYRRDWEDTKQIRLGVEWKATDLMTLRAGYFYDPTPISDDTLDLMWTDADKKTYSVGCGFNFEKFSVDTVFQFTDIEKGRYLGGESEGLNHSYDGAAGVHREVSVSADGYIWGLGLTFNYKL